MNIYLAPLEGITGNIFRTALHNTFGGADKYFTPFITPSEKGALGTKAYNDVLPENNVGQRLVPQILTNSAEGFLTMCSRLAEFGYDEFDLNLGCPSGTVVSKRRGAGFLAYPDELERFLDKIFASQWKISVKTRIGKESPDEFVRLLDIYNRYPMTELIVHPRTRSEMYSGTPHLEIYEYAVKNSENKLCYNGNIFSPADLERLTERFPDTDTVMVGRGAVNDPALISVLKGGPGADKEKLRKFYDSVYCGYEGVLSGNTHLLHKMKEVALHLASGFTDCAKTVKRIKKAKNITEFNAAVSELFECPLRKGNEEFNWYI